MKALLKFLAIVVVGTALLFGGMFGYVEYLQTAKPTTQGVTPSAPAPEPASRRAAFGPYAFDYAVIDGVAVATFTPMLARDDLTVVSAIKAVVRSAYGADIMQSTPVLQGQEIVFKSAFGTFYAMVVKEDTGQVHSVRVRR